MDEASRKRANDIVLTVIAQAPSTPSAEPPDKPSAIAYQYVAHLYAKPHP